jgi:hypothetical protein
MLHLATGLVGSTRDGEANGFPLVYIAMYRNLFYENLVFLRAPRLSNIPVGHGVFGRGPVGQEASIIPLYKSGSTCNGYAIGNSFARLL